MLALLWAVAGQAPVSAQGGLVITSPPPPEGRFGQPYLHQFTTEPAQPAPSYQVTSGMLPPGLSLAPNGVIAGTASQAGTFGPITVCGSTGASAPGCQTFTIVILRALTTLVSEPSAGGAVGTPVRNRVTVLHQAPVQPTGDVTFRLFSDQACTAEVFSSTTPVDAQGMATSTDFVPTVAGTYRWTVSYSGDNNFAPSSLPCSQFNTVTITGGTTTSTTGPTTTTTATTTTTMPPTSTTSTSSSTSTTSSTSTSSTSTTSSSVPTGTTSSSSSTSSTSSSTSTSTSTSSSTTSTTAAPTTTTTGGGTTTTTVPPTTTTSSAGPTTTTTVAPGPTTTRAPGTTTTVAPGTTTTAGLPTSTIPATTTVAPAPTTTVSSTIPFQSTLTSLATPTSVVAAQPVVTATPQQVAAGDTTTLTGSGFPPGSPVQAELFSDPVLLGTTQTDASGAFRLTVTIPRDTTPGFHTVRVSVVGGTVSAETTVFVSAPRVAPAAGGSMVAATTSLSRTGAAVTGPAQLAGALVLAGFVLVGLAWRAPDLPALGRRGAWPRRRGLFR